MERGILTFTMRNGTGDPRDEVRAMFEAHLTYHRRRGERANLETALIIASALPALSLVSPERIPVPVRLVAFIAWAGLLAALVVVRVSEYRWYRRMVGRAGGLER